MPNPLLIKLIFVDPIYKVLIRIILSIYKDVAISSGEGLMPSVWLSFI